MRRVFADKIASVALGCRLTPDVRLSDDIPSEEGVVVAVEVLDDKTSYNQLELASGRMAAVRKGDVLVGALGTLGRRSSATPVTCPTALRPGNVVHLLEPRRRSRCLRRLRPGARSAVYLQSPGRGLELPVPGRAHRSPRPRRAVSRSSAAFRFIFQGIPVIAVAGSCMDAGKTAAACAILARFRHRGLVVDAFKATGVSARRDILAMEDAGARSTLIFTDFGVVTTTSENAPDLAKTMLRTTGREMPGRHPLRARRRSPRRLRRRGHSRRRRDPELPHRRGAFRERSRRRLGRRHAPSRSILGIEPAVVTGPATDNAVGVEIIRERLHLPAANALTSGAALGDLVLEQVLEKRPLRSRSQP